MGYINWVGCGATSFASSWSCKFHHAVFEVCSNAKSLCPDVGLYLDVSRPLVIERRCLLRCRAVEVCHFLSCECLLRFRTRGLTAFVLLKVRERILLQAWFSPFKGSRENEIEELNTDPQILSGTFESRVSTGCCASAPLRS